MVLPRIEGSVPPVRYSSRSGRMPVPTCTQCLPSVPLASFSAASAAVNGRSPLSTSALGRTVAYSTPLSIRLHACLARCAPCHQGSSVAGTAQPSALPEGRAPIHHLPPAGSRCRPLSSSTIRAPLTDAGPIVGQAVPSRGGQRRGEHPPARTDHHSFYTTRSGIP